MMGPIGSLNFMMRSSIKKLVKIFHSSLKVFVTVTPKSPKVNILICCCNHKKRSYLKKKIKFQCPCGFTFDVFNDYKAAIVGIRLHFESFHKDFLPFGITENEILALLKKGRTYEKQKVTPSNFA
jgi:hypothetical protein